MTLTKVLEALEPFAKAAEAMDTFDQRVGNGHHANETAEGFRYVPDMHQPTIGDLRRAREARDALNALLKGEGEDAELIAELRAGDMGFSGAAVAVDAKVAERAADRIAMLTEQVKTLQAREVEDATLIGRLNSAEPLQELMRANNEWITQVKEARAAGFARAKEMAEGEIAIEIQRWDAAVHTPLDNCLHRIAALVEDGGTHD